MSKKRLSSAQIQLLEYLTPVTNATYFVSKSAWYGGDSYEVDTGHTQKVKRIRGTTVRSLIKLGVLVDNGKDAHRPQYIASPSAKEAFRNSKLSNK